MDLVVTEGSKEAIAIYQVQGSNTIFGIMFEIALVLNPHLLEIAEVVVLEVLVGLGVIVVYDASSVEHLVLPLTMISNITTGIIQGSEAVNLSIFPLTIVNTTRLVIELSFSMALTIFSLPLIPGSVVVVFIYKSVLFNLFSLLLILVVFGTHVWMLFCVVILALSFEIFIYFEISNHVFPMIIIFFLLVKTFFTLVVFLPF